MNILLVLDTNLSIVNTINRNQSIYTFVVSNINSKNINLFYDLKKIHIPYQYNRVISYKGIKEICDFSPDLIFYNCNYEMKNYALMVAEYLNIPCLRFNSLDEFNFIIRTFDINEHEYCYKIISIIERDNHFDVVIDYHYSQMVLNLSKKVIEQYDLYIGKTIDRNECEALKDQQKIKDIYYLALKYLSYKDYCYAQLKKKLLDKMVYDEIQVEIALDLLKEKGLINDEDFVRSYINKSHQLGVHQIERNLLKMGISQQILDDYFDSYDETDDYRKACDIIDKMTNNNTHKSINTLKQSIRTKLYRNGFSNHIINQAIDNASFYMSYEDNYQILKKEYRKVYCRYQKKYDQSKLKMKIKQFLIQKGFEYDDIQKIIEEEWEV